MVRSFVCFSAFVFRIHMCQILEPAHARFGFDFFLPLTPTRAIIKTNQKENED